MAAPSRRSVGGATGVSVVGDAAGYSTKKAAPDVGGLLVVPQRRLTRRVACSFLRITNRAAGGTLCLVHLTLGLHFLVTRHLAGRVLDGTLDLVGGTFDVFAIHARFLLEVASLVTPNLLGRSQGIPPRRRTDAAEMLADFDNYHGRDS